MIVSRGFNRWAMICIVCLYGVEMNVKILMSMFTTECFRNKFCFIFIFNANKFLHRLFFSLTSIKQLLEIKKKMTASFIHLLKYKHTPNFKATFSKRFSWSHLLNNRNSYMFFSSKVKHALSSQC